MVDGVTVGDTASRSETGRFAEKERLRGEEEEPGSDGNPYGGYGLGFPVEGEDAVEPPMPPWQPVDDNTGEWNSKPAITANMTRKLVEAAARAVREDFPDASRNLLHFLANTGKSLEQDVDRMLEEIPGLEAATTAEEDALIAQAVSEAQEFEVDGPTTFPVSGDWEGFGYADGAADNRNWFLALGEFDMGISGTITVHPPSGSSENWGYSADTHVHMRDHYNWDEGKTTNFGPVTVEDEFLREMHLQGVAQEFTMFGSSSTRLREGEV